jgi:hypothetical protein
MSEIGRRRLGGGGGGWEAEAMEGRGGSEPHGGKRRIRAKKRLLAEVKRKRPLEKRGLFLRLK